MKKTITTLSMVAFVVGNVTLSHGKALETRTNHEKPLILTADISSFCKAVMQGDVATVQRMLELGEDVNQKSLGLTPAMFAASYNKAEVLQLLIAHGADLNMKSNQGYSVMKYAELSIAAAAMAVLETAMGG